MPLALECDDVHLLTQVTMHTDTVLIAPTDGVQEEITHHRLVPLGVKDLPVIGSNLGVVALKDRSFSPLARYAVDWLIEMGLSLS